MESFQTFVQKFWNGENRLSNFFLSWLAIFISITVPLSLALNFIPDMLNFLKDISLEFAALSSLIIVLFVILDKKNSTFQNVIINSFKMMAIVLLSLLVLIIFSRVVSNKIESKVDQQYQDFNKKLEEGGLNENQIKQINQILLENGTITRTDLERYRFSKSQIDQIVTALISEGFLTEEGARAIFVEMMTADASRIATETVQAEYSTCYVQLDDWASIYIRKYPSDKAEAPGYMMRGERYTAIARDDGSMNQRWWKLEVERGGKISYGWVPSDMVTEIHEHACIDLPIDQ